MTLIHPELERITLRTCACQPAATQLMKCGLFGCAPLRPSLAVDLRVLDFVTRLFLRISPNNTAVCNTIEDFLKCQGYHLCGQVHFHRYFGKLGIDYTLKDPLRRRFANALQWYNRLQQSTNVFVDGVLQNSRQAIQVDAEDTNFTHENLPARNNPQSEGLFTPENSPSPASDEEDQRPGKRGCREPASSTHTRPSDYLCARCPICFGGKSCFSEGYVISYHLKFGFC